MNDNSQPTLSVIVPVFNRSAVLPRLLRSVERQVCGAGELEVVVADDGSTDGSAEVAEDWRDRLRIRVVRIPERSGAPSARNVGAAAAAGDYLAFVDSDDELIDWWLERILEAIRSQGSDVITCGCWLDQPGARPGVALPTNWYGGAPINWLAACMILKRELFESVGGYDELLYSSENEGLWLSLLNASSEINVTPIYEPLMVYHRGTPGSVTKDHEVRLAGAERLLSGGYREMVPADDRLRIAGLWHRIAATEALALGRGSTARAHLGHAAVLDPSFLTRARIVFTYLPAGIRRTLGALRGFEFRAQKRIGRVLTVREARDSARGSAPDGAGTVQTRLLSKCDSDELLCDQQRQRWRELTDGVAYYYELSGDLLRVRSEGI